MTNLWGGNTSYQRSFQLSHVLSLSLLDVVFLPHLDDVQGWFRVDDFLRGELGDGDSGSWVMTKKLRLEMTIKGRARGLWYTQQFHDC